MASLHPLRTIVTLWCRDDRFSALTCFWKVTESALCRELSGELIVGNIVWSHIDNVIVYKNCIYFVVYKSMMRCERRLRDLYACPCQVQCVPRLCVGISYDALHCTAFIILRRAVLQTETQYLLYYCCTVG